MIKGAAGQSLTRIFVDPALPSAGILRAVIRQIGFASADRPAAADAAIARHPVEGVPSWCPGAGFALDGQGASFDSAAITGLDLYKRRSGLLDISGRSFSICADHGDKSEVLHQCAATLLGLLLAAGREARFLWWYPDGARGAVNYRVDVDDHEGDAFDIVSRWLEPGLAWSSLYFTTAHFVGSVPAIRRCAEAGAEIGSHFHYHYTFERDPATNTRNLRTSVEFLRGQGFAVDGMVTPSGKSFAGVGRTLRANGLSYTSNFGHLFDALPFEADDGGERYLEVPIHPVAPGNLIKAATSLDGLEVWLTDYYLAMAEQLSMAGLPLFFYGHTNDNVRVRLFPRLLNELRNRYPDHAFVRLDRYAAFWRERLARLDRGGAGARPQDIGVISPARPGMVTVGERSWQLPLDRLFRSPLRFIGSGTAKPRLRDRLADRYELETVVPIRGLSLTSGHGWLSAGYKLVRRAARSALR